MTAVIAWLTFLAVASTPAYADVKTVGIYSINYSEAVVGYPGHLVPAPVEFARHYLDVSWCESGHNPLAVGAIGERGLMQIAPVHIPRINRLGFTWNDMFEPTANILVAIDIWLDTESWAAWSCKPVLDSGR